MEQARLRDSFRASPVEGSMPEAAAFAEGFLERAEVPVKAALRVQVAVDEIWANIVSYSGAAEAGIEASASEDSVELAFSDDGVPYDPLAKPDPDVTLPAEEREIGGLGIFITKKTMDAVDYRREDDRNILTIRKDF